VLPPVPACVRSSTTAVALGRSLGLDGSIWIGSILMQTQKLLIRSIGEGAACWFGYVGTKVLKTSTGATFLVSRHGSITLTTDIAGGDKYLDFWNLMGYDIAGSRSTVSGNQANLYVTDVSVDDAVERHMAAGVDKKKIYVHATVRRRICRAGRRSLSLEGVGMRTTTTMCFLN
jgi:hypothetical protein